VRPVVTPVVTTNATAPEADPRPESLNSEDLYLNQHLSKKL
jgi:hypothetical protein